MHSYGGKIILSVLIIFGLLTLLEPEVGAYGETRDSYWRAPRVPVMASDGTVRHVSRTYLYNRRYGSSYTYPPVRYRYSTPRMIGYDQYPEIEVRGGGGFLTRVLEMLF